MSAAERPRRSPWPYAIAGVFLVVVAANLTLILISTADPQLMETDHYYEHALAYGEVIEARAASDALGWRAGVTAAAGGLRYALRDRAGAPVRGLKGAVVVRRQDTTRFDQTLPLTEAAPGIYEATGVKGTGRLHLRARLEGAAAPWVDDRWLKVP